MVISARRRPRFGDTEASFALTELRSVDATDALNGACHMLG